jgi:L-arabinose isomerase
MALHDVRVARIGHFGHPIEHMLDMQTDQAALTAAFGCHVLQTEADDLLRVERAVTDDDVRRKTGESPGLFDTPDRAGSSSFSRKAGASRDRSGDGQHEHARLLRPRPAYPS